jgi:hypothetical protein
VFVNIVTSCEQYPWEEEATDPTTLCVVEVLPPEAKAAIKQVRHHLAVLG